MSPATKLSIEREGEDVIIPQDGGKGDRSRFSFSQTWFDLIRGEWETRTASLRGGDCQKLRILELGSFEGASTTWMLDNLMDHPESSMTVVDTFEGGMRYREQHGGGGGVDNGDRDELMYSSSSSLEERFRSNVSKCEHYAKLQIMKMDTSAALLELRRRASEFDFIYVDASHVAVDVLHDAVMCWPMLSTFGTIVFDDFSWKGYMEDCYNPRIAVEAFLKCAKPEVESEETESQIWVRKVPNRIPATPNPDPALCYWDKGLAKK